VHQVVKKIQKNFLYVVLCLKGGNNLEFQKKIPQIIQTETHVMWVSITIKGPFTNLPMGFSFDTSIQQKNKI